MIPELHDNQGVANAAGTITVLWGRIESNLGDLLIQYIGICDALTAQILLSELDIRSRAKLCKAYSIVHDHPTVAEIVERAVRLIDDKIRPARNDITHGYYEFEPELKIYKPKIARIKTPHKPPTIELQPPIEIGERKLRFLIAAMEEIGVFIFSLHNFKNGPLLRETDPDFEMTKSQLSRILDRVADSITSYAR